MSITAVIIIINMCTGGIELRPSDMLPDYTMTILLLDHTAVIGYVAIIN